MHICILILIHYYNLVYFQRQKGHDSESSSASSAAETDSGRGSHEDVVLDQAGPRLQLDKSRGNIIGQGYN
jgi:hypothetical protein